MAALMCKRKEFEKIEGFSLQYADNLGFWVNVFFSDESYDRKQNIWHRVNTEL